MSELITASKIPYAREIGIHKNINQPDTFYCALDAEKVNAMSKGELVQMRNTLEENLTKQEGEKFVLGAVEYVYDIVTDNLVVLLYFHKEA